jgi:ribosomal protein S18 acetylase RimI-like enzyme
MIRVRSATIADLPALTAVLSDAFNVKMNVLFGRQPDRVRTILSAIYRGPLLRGFDGILVAERESRVVGALVIEPMPWSSEDVHRLNAMIDGELNAWRRAWNRLGYTVFTHGPDEGDAYLSDVGVLRSARGEGVGKALVAEAERWAIARNRRAMTLWVASNNAVARRLYERAGMVAARHEINLLSGILYGIPRWTYMRKELPPCP